VSWRRFPFIPDLSVSRIIPNLLFIGAPEGRREVVAQVGQACEEIGVFTIGEHGVSEKLLAQTADTARRFFDLSLEDKMKVPVNSIGAGYVPIKAEALAASLGQKTPGDLKESFNIGRNFAANPWPQSPSELKSVWMQYFTTLNALGADIMRIFALALDLPEDYFEGAQPT
jgi:isopenicillin N synthase-like dioxygenase